MASRCVSSIVSIWFLHALYIEIAEVEGSSWAAVAYVSRGEVLSELYILTDIMIKVSIIAVFILTLLVTIQVRRIIGRPVKELSRVATRIVSRSVSEISLIYFM